MSNFVVSSTFVRSVVVDESIFSAPCHVSIDVSRAFSLHYTLPIHTVHDNYCRILHVQLSASYR